MARPGEEREVLRAVFAQTGGVTWREAAVHGQVGYTVACRTVKNMVRAGELVPVGRDKPAGSKVWHHIYALATPEDIAAEQAAEQAEADRPKAWGGIEEVAAIIQLWPLGEGP